ncbi:MAG: hypothetical protein K1X71_05410 [Pirellulales bacterium]|nr:hypothetical protein [Pirellulales bacterium]
MLQTPNFEKLPEIIRRPALRYVEHVAAVGAGKLLGVTVFGSVAEGARPGGRHRLQSVIVLSEMDLEILRRLAPAGEEFGPWCISTPLPMTPDYICASLDSFPLELLEIQQTRLMLWGGDYFNALDFDDAHLRLECERELKGALAGIHQGILGSGGRPAAIDLLQQQAAANMLRVLRGLLWVHGERQPLAESWLVERAEVKFETRLPALRQAIEAEADHDWPKLRQLYDEVSTLGKLADGR